MLSKEEIEQLQNIVRDNHFSIERRRDAFLQLQEAEAAVLESDLNDYEAVAAVPAAASEKDPNKHRIYKRIAKRLGHSTGRHSGLLISSIRWVGRVAAVVALAIGLFTFFQHAGQPGAGNGPLAQQEAIPLISPDDRFDTLINKKNNVRKFLLPDSSLVELAPQSYVYYQKHFAAHAKIVFLRGEAKFSVHKEEDRPFSVYVNDIEVRDLGTVFYIKSDGSRLKVLLIKGKVLVHSLKPSIAIPDIALVPGQEFAINTLSGNYSVGFPGLTKEQKKNTDTTSLNLNELLLTRALPFENTPIEEVLESLHKEFNVTIEMNTKGKADLLFTGQFTEFMSLSQILNVLSRSYDLDIHVAGSSIILKAKRK
jgi:hypothetical protein